MKKVIGLIITAMMTACAGTEVKTEEEVASVQTKPTETDSSFYQHWVHSFEDQNGQSGNIFRPAGSREFAPSRFRMAFAFDPSGECNYMDLSPTGAHQMRNCVYTKIGEKVFLYDSGGRALNHLAFTIQSVNATEMRIIHSAEKTKEQKPQ